MVDIFRGFLKSVVTQSEVFSTKKPLALKELDFLITDAYFQALSSIDNKAVSHNPIRQKTIGFSDICDGGDQENRLILLSNKVDIYTGRLPDFESDISYVRMPDWVKRQIALILLDGKSKGSINLDILREVLKDKFKQLDSNVFNESVTIISNYIKNGGIENTNGGVGTTHSK